MNPTDRDPNAPPTPDATAPRAEPAATEASAPGDGAPRGEPGTGPESDEQRRRNRNRRRGRRNRGGNRPEDGAGGPPLEVTLRWDEPDDDDEESAEGSSEAEPAGAEPGPEWTPVEASERFTDVVSGAYDNEPAPEPEGESARRVLAAAPDAPKLHKVLAQAGIGSRRDMEQMIADGQITVNGQAAHVGQRITAHDQIRVAGKPVRVRITPPPARVLAYHKPAGEIVTRIAREAEALLRTPRKG